MAYYPYRKEGQDKYVKEFEPFILVPKEKQFRLPKDKSVDVPGRIMPPWSQQGAFAIGSLVHYGLGLNNLMSLCPTVVGKECPYCNVKAKLRGEYEKYKPDLQVIRASNAYWSNFVLLNDQKNGVVVWSYGYHFFAQLKKFQDSGQYGDITDPKTGRDLTVSRTVQGSTIVADMIVPHGTPTPLANPEWLDQLYNLDTILPEPNVEKVYLAFKSHPWKVYHPDVQVQVPANAPVGKQTEAAKPVFNPTPPVEEKPVETPAPTPPVEETTRMEKLRKIEEDFRARMEAAKAQVV